MGQSTSSKTVIMTALLANFFIALMKLVVSILTGSSAILAEAIHSFADTFNQIFLLVGLKKGEKAPDLLHPFGFSRELYFWSFIVAIILFSIGGIFSVYEGIHKLLHPEPIDHIIYAFIVLILSILAEGTAFQKALKKINRERHDLTIYQYLRQTKKSELIVVFLEDMAAISGLSTALILIILQHLTGILIFDGIASMIIGLILCCVALFLGNEIRSLLIGESAAPATIKKIAEIFRQETNIKRVVFIKSLQLGPSDILLAVNAEFNPQLTAITISQIIDDIEREIGEKFPEVKKIFIEPDLIQTS